MFMILMRLLIFIMIIFLLYITIKYLLNPKRKLELAHEQKKFYFHDDSNNVRKNFLITYKGVMFEGEKQLGTTEQAFDVVSILIWPKNPNQLKGIERNDLYFIEKEVLIHYPHAKIKWKSPIKDFLQKY